MSTMLIGTSSFTVEIQTVRVLDSYGSMNVGRAVISPISM
jgi:hypothetical protein